MLVVGQIENFYLQRNIHFSSFTLLLLLLHVRKEKLSGMFKKKKKGLKLVLVLFHKLGSNYITTIKEIYNMFFPYCRPHMVSIHVLEPNGSKAKVSISNIKPIWTHIF